MKLRTLLLAALGAALLCTVSCKKDQKGFSGTSLDMGISVKWATMNAGASKQGEIGTEMTVQEALQYAADSKKYRLPTIDEWDDLFEHTTHSFTHTADGDGFLFISAAGTQLYVPAAKYLCQIDGNVITYADLTTSTAKPVTTESTGGTYAIRMVRK